MILTDWRGNDYTIGDTVLYPRTSGRSVEMSEGVVLEIVRGWGGMYNSFTRLAEDEDPPEIRQRDGWDHEARETIWTTVTAPVVYRVKLKPSGRTSRNFGYYSDWERNEETGRREHTGDVKPVTIQNVQNITALEV